MPRKNPEPVPTKKATTISEVATFRRFEGNQLIDIVHGIDWQIEFPMPIQNWPIENSLDIGWLEKEKMKFLYKDWVCN